MGFNRPQAKLEAKRIIKDGKFKLKWMVALFLILTLTISQLVLMLSGYQEYANKVAESANETLPVLNEMLEADTFDTDEYLTVYGDYMDTLTSFPKVSPVSILFCVVLLIMGSIMSAGFEWWCLLNSRRLPNDFRNMFDGFGFTFKLIALIAIRGLLTAFGMLLFIVPGIFLSICFSQSTFILFENPKMGVIQCLSKSVKLIDGHKADYFLLQLSFFGWMLASTLVTYYVAIFLSLAGLAMISAYSSIVFEIWLTPYMGITRAGFYNYLTGYTAPAEQPSQEDNTL